MWPSQEANCLSAAVPLRKKVIHAFIRLVSCCFPLVNPGACYDCRHLGLNDHEVFGHVIRRCINVS